MSKPALIVASLVAVFAVTAGLAAGARQYPRDIVVTADYKTENVSMTAKVTIHVEQLMRESNHERLITALRQGGYPSFLPLFRRLPVLGSVQLDTRKVDLRYARSQATDEGERLILVTDGPLFFVMGGAADAKARGGYVLSIVELQLDANGSGSGTMSAAARIKPDADGNVAVDDYAENPITVTVVGR
jgi:hypothetical protein